MTRDIRLPILQHAMSQNKVFFSFIFQSQHYAIRSCNKAQMAPGVEGSFLRDGWIRECG